MKKIQITLLLVIGLIYTTSAQNYLIKANYDAETLKTKWDKYIENPSESNALKVYKVLPEKGHVRKTDSDLVLQKNIYNNLKTLEKQVLKGDKNSVKLAFRLNTISDGAFTEWLQEMLGQTINTHPKLFLTQLKKHIHLFENINSLVSNYGQDYADSWDKQISETKRRLKSLKTVNSSKLSAVKKRCLKSLNKQLKALVSYKNNSAR